MPCPLQMTRSQSTEELSQLILFIYLFIYLSYLSSYFLTPLLLFHNYSVSQHLPSSCFFFFSPLFQNSACSIISWSTRQAVNTFTPAWLFLRCGSGGLAAVATFKNSNVRVWEKKVRK